MTFMRLSEWLSHFLVPRESNNYRAKALHHSSLSSVIGLVLFLQLGMSLLMVLKPSVLGFASQISPDRVVQLTNEERAKIGAPPLSLSEFLSDSAKRKAGDMFAYDYWAHNSPSGRDPWSFFKDVGYRYLYAGENLARDFQSPESVVAAWMSSPTHRENLLNPKYREIGISVVDGRLGGAETTLVVQHFGTPLSGPLAKVAEKSVENEPVVTQQGPSPTSIPVMVAQVNRQGQSLSTTLAEAKGTRKSLVSPFAFSKNVSLVILLVLIGVIAADMIIASRKKIIRLTGRSVAHLLFLGGAVLLVVLSNQGLLM